jgi:cell division septal protein FtsQ
LLDVGVRRSTATAQRMRRVTYWAGVLVLLVAGIGGAVYGVREGMKKFFWQNADYKLSEIAVTKDGTLTRQQILDASGIREGANIFSINLAQAQEKIAALPQVEHAELQRTLPNKIAINVAERKPVAWITAKASDEPSTAPDAFLVDRRGVVMKIKNRRLEYQHLPVITGMPTENFDEGQTVSSQELKSALDLIRLTSESAVQSRFQVRSIDLSKGYCMVVTNQTHAQITFGLDRVESQLERLAIFLDRIEQSRRELRAINLMVQRNVPVTFAPLDGVAENETPAESAPDKKDGVNGKKTDASKDKSKTSANGKASPTPAKNPKTPNVRRAIPIEPFRNTNP